MQQPTVIKIGGNEIDDPLLLTALAAAVRDYPAPVVLVHGGGKEISTLQTALGIEPRYVDGLRVTDAPSLAVVEMVLCGVVNKRVVRHLVAAGVDAVGMSGVDRGLIRARKMLHPTVDMGCTGEIVAVRSEMLQTLLTAGVTPVIAPVCYGEAHNFNVNADHVAAAVAVAVGADRVVFITNVPGVLVDGQVQPALTVNAAETLIAQGIISGGMIPKVRTALGVLAPGVPGAVITDLDGFKAGSGTVFVRSESETPASD